MVICVALYYLYNIKKLNNNYFKYKSINELELKINKKNST